MNIQWVHVYKPRNLFLLFSQSSRMLYPIHRQVVNQHFGLSRLVCNVRNYLPFNTA